MPGTHEDSGSNIFVINSIDIQNIIGDNFRFNNPISIKRMT